MGTQVFFGNRKDEGLRLKPGDLERIGIKATGPVLCGKASVSEAREQVERAATETERYLQRGRVGDGR